MKKCNCGAEATITVSFSDGGKWVSLCRACFRKVHEKIMAGRNWKDTL